MPVIKFAHRLRESSRATDKTRRLAQKRARPFVRAKRAWKQRAIKLFRLVMSPLQKSLLSYSLFFFFFFFRKRALLALHFIFFIERPSNSAVFLRVAITSYSTRYRHSFSSQSGACDDVYYRTTVKYLNVNR